MKVHTVLKNLAAKPGYTLMRGLARFPTLRRGTSLVHHIAHRSPKKALLDRARQRLNESVFQNIDVDDFVHRLQRDGIALGLALPTDIVQSIVDWAETAPCYADRNPQHGFQLTNRAQAEEALGKPIMLAQYFNTTRECPAITRLANDPVLQLIAASYLNTVPKFVGTNLWWTFPVQALEEDRDRHAHLFHRDVDDFRFFKFFFYLTDVHANEGAHVCVIGSHNQPPRLRAGDRWNIRRYSDAEIQTSYPSEEIQEICGSAGVGFAENTLCIHKGSTPKQEARLLLQFQFALFDYGVTDDIRTASQLRLL